MDADAVIRSSRDNSHSCRCRDPRAIIIVASAFIINGITSGITNTDDLYSNSFLKEFKAGKTVTAWVIGLQTSLICLAGIIAGLLTARYGTRLVAIAGALLSSSGFLLSSLSPNVEFLYLSYDVMPGIGFAFLQLSQVVAVQQHTSKRRALAAGIAGIDFIQAPIIVLFTRWAMTPYGWRGSLMLLSGILLHTLPCALLLRPPPPCLQEEDREHQGQQTTKMRNCIKSAKTCHLGNCWQRIKAFFVPSVHDNEPLPTPVIVLGIASWFFFFAGLPVFHHFMELKTLSYNILMVFTTIGKISGILVGIILGSMHEKLPLIINASSVMAAGVCTAAIGLCSTYNQMKMACIVYGIAIGMATSMYITAFRDLVGINHLPWAVGVAFTFGEIGSLLSIIIFHYALGQTGSFFIPCLIGGVLLVMMGICLIGAKFIKK